MTSVILSIGDSTVFIIQGNTSKSDQWWMFKTERHYRSPRHIKTWADWLPFCDGMINLVVFSTAVVCFEYILTRIHFWDSNDNHWFTRRFSAEMVTGHSMEHRWPRFQTSSGVTRPQRINMRTNTVEPSQYEHASQSVMTIPITKIRRSHDHLTRMRGTTIPGRTVFTLRWAPGPHRSCI